MHKIRRSCVLFLWMYTLTFVKSQDCTREQFIGSKQFDLNFDTSDLEASYPPGKQVRVSCNVGYTGFFKLICTEGNWRSIGTKCQAKSCGHPGDAQFADFHLEKGDDFVFGSQVVYNCHKGYQMVSRRNFRTCMAAGWDGVVPVCEAQQCPAIYINNTIQVTGDAEEATYGNVLRFSCKSSTEILYGPTEIYCDENGMWSDNPPRCEAVKCKVPEIEHGTVTGDIRVYNEHEILYFECNARYGKSEERPSKCTKMGQRADWSPTPACEPIKCKLQVSQPEGTRYDPPHRNVFSPGETLRVTCEETHWIFNPREISTVITCRDDGQWTSDPTCKEVTCSRPHDQHIYTWDNYWQRKKILGDTVRYSCTSGYKSTNGATRATCTRDGWTPDPLCQEITCDRREIPNAAIENMKEKYKYFERAYYVCNEGYRGRFTLTCTERGWDNNPQCTEITCDPLVYRNADIVNYKNIYRSKEQAVYKCRDGYRGGFTLTCTEQGWIGRAQCTELTCDRREIPNAAIQNIKEKYKVSEQVHYVCNEGYRGRFTLTCTERGWDKNPQCTEITCDPPTYDDSDIVNPKKKYKFKEQAEYKCKDADNERFFLTCGEEGWGKKPQCTTTECQKPEFPNGFIVGPDKNKMYYYTCNEGYKLLTKGWWSTAKCNDSVWSELHQCIANTSCSLPDVPNGEVTPKQNSYEQGANVLIICKQGYRSEVAELTCREGKWPELQQICTPITNSCLPPPKVKNAVVVTSYQKEYLHDSEVTYQCRQSYTIEGNNKITCKNGKWQNVDITCTNVTYVAADKLTDTNMRPTFVSCEPPPDGLTVKNLPEDQGHILPEHRIEISCPQGTRLNGSSQLTCGENGQWDNPFPTCETPGCGEPPQVEGGVIIGTVKTTYRSGERVEYNCEANSNLSFKKTCKNGVWTGNTRCTLSCDPPPEELIIKDLQEDLGPILPDRFIEISCPPGKRVNGSSVLTCGKNGQWNYPFPTCEVVTCEPPPEGLIVKGLPEDHGPILPERLIQISCPPEKTLNGSSGLSCGQDGQWNGPFPTCEDKCRFTGVAQGVLFTPRPARGHMFNRGQKLQFGCHMYGHVLHGNAEVVCSGNGQWSDPFPTCGPPSGCGKPPPLADGDTRVTSKYKYNHNDRVEYVCKNHYTMRGEPFKICNNGDWTGNITCLRPCTVDKEIMLKHNIAFLYSGEEKLYSPHETSLSFRCTGRTRHVGPVSMRQQCIDGVISLPTCQ